MELYKATGKRPMFSEFLQYLNNDYIKELIGAYVRPQPYGDTRLISLISENIQKGTLSTYIDEDIRLIDDLRDMHKACVNHITRLSYNGEHSPTLTYDLFQLVQPVAEKIAHRLGDPLVEYGN